MRSFKIAAVALMALSLAACGKSKSFEALPDDMDLGSKDAKITVVEYASVGCPICAKWQKEVFPAFKAKYVDTGKVHYVFREMLVGGTEEVTVASAGFLVARCAGKDKYFAVNDAIFASQPGVFYSPRETLSDIAKSVGMSEEQFNRCVSDEAAITALNKRVENNAKAHDIDATPTFEINGHKMEPGYHALAEIDAAIAAAGK
ncbi:MULTISPECIES: thioredoxin domain-containing protein [unclassified Caulobacter]|jgi:protein-disulfide isomerase|uniref:thioredoxin domain-containing protein n=1 Tax=unclassified Caulobacter TaxID=2648921 RepID=UPI0006FE24D5|nr:MULTISPECIES: thioredoxin domain-containing protein [unclassified Caulobacter]KQV55271.1 disulfide bond formation protein DsbA [Caulobacter sp. Root342]KQV63540.1 disulfide bond formation protein DsbA [Caulobacter sp. Root343]